MTFYYLVYFRITSEFKDRNYRTNGLFKFPFNDVEPLQKHLLQLCILMFFFFFFCSNWSWLYFATVLVQASRHFIVKSVLIHSSGIMGQSNTFLDCLLETVQWRWFGGLREPAFNFR